MKNLKDTINEKLIIKGDMDVDPIIKLKNEGVLVQSKNDLVNLDKTLFTPPIVDFIYEWTADADDNIMGLYAFHYDRTVLDGKPNHPLNSFLNVYRERYNLDIDNYKVAAKKDDDHNCVTLYYDEDGKTKIIREIYVMGNAASPFEMYLLIPNDKITSEK